MKRNRVRDNKPSNKMAGFAIVVIVVFLAVFLNMRSNTINASNAATEKEIQELQSQIADEENRTQELDEYEKYTKTKQFAEEYARNYLGLCYPDEIIFKSEDN